MHGFGGPDVDSSRLLEILKSEIRLATGCTEVAAAALAAAKAVETLGEKPGTVTLTVSPNVYKNGAQVGVPGTPLKGLAAAVALGAVIGKPGEGLGILGSVDPAKLAAAEVLLDSDAVQVTCDADSRETVYLRADATAEKGAGSAGVVIQGMHDHVARIWRHGIEVFRDHAPTNGDDDTAVLRAIPVSSLLGLIDDMSPSDLGFLVEAAEITAAAADNDLADPKSRLGPSLYRRIGGTGVAAGRARAQALSGAAAEARMAGRLVPVMAITGSGNHGIANFLGVYGLAQSLGVSRDQLARALAIASTVTVCVKAYTGKLTAFCGCAIAPATGLAAAAVDLLGGDAEARDHAMQSVIGTFAGMLCDGAKESCAFKVSTAVGAAIDIAELAVEGAFVRDGDGVVGKNIDETFARLARLNDPGMRETERIVLEFVEDGE